MPSRGVIPEMTDDMKVDIAQAAPNPAASPMRCNCKHLLHHRADNGARRSAQRQPHANLVLSFSHGNRHHSADARRRDAQCDHREDAEKDRGGSPWFEPVATQIVVIGCTSATTAFGSMSCAIQASCCESSGDGCDAADDNAHDAPWRDSQNDPYASSTGSLSRATCLMSLTTPTIGSHCPVETEICFPTASPRGQ